MRFTALKVLLISLFLLALGCSSDDVYDANSAEGAFKSAEKLQADERFEDALQRYREVQNKHPYSRYAVEAKLRVSDIHFERESYAEAQASYQLFKELHPRHARIDYVTFRLGLSYFKQLPSTIDRDLSLANNAILYFDEVITSYSSSSYVAEAKAKKTEARHMLAEKELYIAHFYYIRDMYDSAFRRYQKMVKTYPDSPQKPKGLWGASMSAMKNGDRDQTLIYARILFEKYPDSDETRELKVDLEKNGIR